MDRTRLFPKPLLALLLMASFSLSAAAQTAPAKPAAKPAAASAGSKPWQQIRVPKLHEFHPQKPKRIELANGMVIFLQEDHELPLIDGTIMVRGGSREEPADKVGMVSLYGRTWRTGGTKARTGDQLDDYLEARAARVETSGSSASTSLSWSCLKQDEEDVFSAVLELLTGPEFRDDKIALAKQAMNTGIARRNDDASGIATREVTKLAYGAQSGYARQSEYATIASVKRDDLLAWHRRTVQPNNIILGVVGDFDSAAMEARLRKAFDAWPRGLEMSRRPSVEISPAKPGYYFIAKDDVNQSQVDMVHLGITRDNPDYYAVVVMNEVLGGGFSGRLMNNIRTRKGLAYGVGGGVGSAFDHPGLFNIGMGTKSGTTVEAIHALYQELDDLEKKPATAEELKHAKDSILNGFIFQYDSKDKVLDEQMAFEFYGYPADFLERFRDNIDKVTADDVARVAHKYVHKDRVAVLVVGKAADFDKPLSSLGPVTDIDIAIPEGAPKTAAPKPAASNPEGKALMAKIVAAMGGAAKVAPVTAMHQKVTAVRNTPQGDIPIEVDQVIAYPDRLRMQMSLPMGEILMMVTPAGGYMGAGGQGGEMPAGQRDEMLRAVKRDMIYVAQHSEDPKYIFAASGTEKVGGADSAVLDIVGDGAEMRWYVDPASGHVLRSRFRTLGNAGPVDRVVDYSDWRDTGGLSLPYKRTVRENDEPYSQDEIKEFQLNPPLDPKTFEMPADAKNPGQ